MTLKIYGYADHSSIIDEDTGKLHAIFYDSPEGYPFHHAALARHYKNLYDCRPRVSLWMNFMRRWWFKNKYPHPLDKKTNIG